MKKKWIVLLLIISMIIFPLILIGYTFRTINNLNTYIKDSDYYFKGTVVDRVDFTIYYCCLIIEVDTISIKTIADTKYYAGAYNKEKGLVAFFTGLDSNLKPNQVTVNSQINKVSYDGYPDADSKINIMTYYKKQFIKVLNKEGGYWEWL